MKSSFPFFRFDKQINKLIVIIQNDIWILYDYEHKTRPITLPSPKNSKKNNNILLVYKYI